MNISELIAKLEKMRSEHGELDVFFRTDDGDVWSVGGGYVHEAEEDEFPLDWNIPAGYTFVMLSN